MEISSTLLWLIGTGMTIGVIISVIFIMQQVRRSYWIDSYSKRMTWVFLVVVILALVIMWGSFLLLIV